MLELQRQPSRWTCLPTAFAMVMGEDVRDILAHIGRDDDRGYHHQELVEYALTQGWSFAQIDTKPLMESREDVSFLKLKPLPQWLNLFPAVLIDQHHAVAWCPRRRKILDPNFTVYDLSGFSPEIGWLGTRF